MSSCNGGVVEGMLLAMGLRMTSLRPNIWRADGMVDPVGRWFVQTIVPMDTITFFFFFFYTSGCYERQEVIVWKSLITSHCHLADSKACLLSACPLLLSATCSCLWWVFFQTCSLLLNQSFVLLNLYDWRFMGKRGGWILRKVHWKVCAVECRGVLGMYLAQFLWLLTQKVFMKQLISWLAILTCTLVYTVDGN